MDGLGVRALLTASGVNKVSGSRNRDSTAEGDRREVGIHPRHRRISVSRERETRGPAPAGNEQGDTDDRARPTHRLTQQSPDRIESERYRQPDPDGGKPAQELRRGCGLGRDEAVCALPPARH